MLLSRMNSVPRILGMGLLVVLAALAALLGASAWNAQHANPKPTGTAIVATGAAEAPPAAYPTRLSALPTRMALALALTAFALAVMLVFSLTLRGPGRHDTRQPFAAARTEMTTLASLAKTSLAQGEELSRERDVRRRAEEDAQLKQQMLTQSLDEKIRLGQDLHDGIIQSLYAVGLTLESVRELVKANPAEADRRLEKIRSGLNDTIHDVRAYITGLAPENLRRGGFSNALDTLLAELGAGRNARFDVQIDGDAAGLLSPDQSLQALQIAREAVSNALRHGGASVVTLRMHKSDHEVCLLIQDNGSGFNPATTRDGGHGLTNMQARAKTLGATVRVTSQPTEGSRILATLPIHASSAA
jgi:signal transduction histidine kinase